MRGANHTNKGRDTGVLPRHRQTWNDLSELVGAGNPRLRQRLRVDGSNCNRDVLQGLRAALSRHGYLLWLGLCCTLATLVNRSQEGLGNHWSASVGLLHQQAKSTKVPHTTSPFTSNYVVVRVLWFLRMHYTFYTSTA
ncbi:hypothetical protein NOVOSPHI9U_260262 [Novosphingobium sp. 9U]|nr:hypothetical protein NOVOSPHI9U_260262 [Novosphingobium sp. 9U]